MEKSYFDVWRKNIIILIICLIGGFTFSWVKVSKEKGYFESSASIWIKTVNYEKTSIREALSFLNPKILAGVEVMTQCHLMKSSLVLKDVVRQLNLAGDDKDEIRRMINLIKSRTMVSPLENTKIVTITVRWDNPEMAIKAANAIAHAYMSFIYKQQQDAYDEVYVLQDEQVKLAKQKIMKSDELAMRSINEKVYLMMLEMREDTRLNKSMAMGSTGEIQLLEPAFGASFRSVRKKLKLFLGTVIGLFIGAGAVVVREYLATPLWSGKQK
jgi:uncharacterized protein involved in exopolysaccharide biosynthesis